MNWEYSQQRLGKCSERFRKGNRRPHSSKDESGVGATANIIFNLAHLGITIEDAKNFDLQTYFDLIELEMRVITNEKGSRRATQIEIDAFLH